MDVDLKACANGDKRAWDAFVDRYAGVIVAAVRRAAGTPSAPEDVDDAVQDVFVRLVKDDFRLLRSFDPARASLPTWLTIVARSVTRDRLRRRHAPAMSLDGHADVAAPPPRHGEAPDLPALDVLTARQRLVLHLLYERDLEVADVARLLGVDAQTIRSTRHKALERLRHPDPERAEFRPPGDVAARPCVRPEEAP
jgi:RNA polymerase sigma-70 factor (ECF subfamily)